jgi:DNA-binding response OmpR family regulator
MDLLRGHDWTPTDRSIDNLVMRLRRKIEPDPEQPRLIKSVRGVGYCFAATVSSAA